MYTIPVQSVVAHPGCVGGGRFRGGEDFFLTILPQWKFRLTADGIWFPYIIICSETNAYYYNGAPENQQYTPKSFATAVFNDAAVCIYVYTKS